MAQQCAFFFGGVPAEGGGNFTLLPGIEPSTAILRFTLGARLPQIGPLTLRAGSRAITFRNCRLARRVATSGENGRWQEVTILDRRWGWVDSLYPISGEYNRSSEPFNVKTDIELAQLLMTAMLESGYNIAALAGQSYTPVAWDSYGAPGELDLICRARGMFPTLGLNDQVAIVVDGLGNPPTNVPEAMDYTESAELPIIPSLLTLEGGQTSIQHDLPLVPVAREVSGANAGKYIEIDSLSYKPPLGWENEDPINFPTVKNDSPAAWSICKSDVWKMYAIRTKFTLPDPPWFDRSPPYKDRTRYFTVDAGKAWRILPLLAEQMDGSRLQILGYYNLLNAPGRNNTGDATIGNVLNGNPNALDGSSPIAPVPVTDNRLIYSDAFVLDQASGQVQFDNPVYFKDDIDGYLPAPIRLRTTFPLRDPETAAVLCQQYQLAPGSPVGVRVARTIKDSSIYFKYREGEHNIPEFTAASLIRLNAELQTYRIGVGASVPYKGFYFGRSIDGIVKSISWDISDGGAATTHIDYNMERPEQYLTLRELRLRREVTYNLYVADQNRRRKLRGLLP